MYLWNKVQTLKQWRKFASRRRHQLLTLSNLSISQLIIILLGLASSTLWARYVPIETYGEYQVILSLIYLVGSYCLTGLGESVTISAAKLYDGNLSKIVKLKLGVTLVGSIVLVGFGLFYRISQPNLANGLFFVAFLFPFYQLSTIWSSWLIGRGELNRRAFLNVSNLLIRVGALGLLIFASRTILNELLIGVIALPALFSLCVVIYIFRHRVNNLTHNETIKYGFHTSAATLLGGLVVTDKLIINNQLSAADVAIYSIALIFPDQIKALYSIFNQIITPQIYKATSVAEAWRYLKRKLVLLIALFSLIGLAGFIAIPILVPLLFSERYVASVPYAKWLWLNLAITAPATYLGNILRAQKKVNFVYAVSICFPLFTFVLYLTLVAYGLKGLVLAKIIMQWVISGIYIFSFLYYLKLTERSKIV